MPRLAASSAASMESGRSVAAGDDALVQTCSTARAAGSPAANGVANDWECTGLGEDYEDSVIDF
eukprot:scaffold34887_cov61-Phaeocystis_antarctica.AAC.4